MACNSTILALLLALALGTAKAGWVDPDTPEFFQSTVSLTPGDEREYSIVFSDEFEKDGRSFRDGEDPRWTAIDKNDYTNDALHYYSSDNAKTMGGVLNITTEMKTKTFKAFNETSEKDFAEKKHYKSAMLQGWNKFCITGGIVEVRAKLPGNAYTGGLWPAIWLLGNLSRATFVGSSNFMWPWSYDNCKKKYRYSQEISACSKVSHYGMDALKGRGSPEIDILEAMGGAVGPLPNTGMERPYFSASLQIAPGIEDNRPIVGHQPEKGHWYSGMEYGNITNSTLNNFFYGVTLVHEPSSYTYQSDALSANMHINSSYYDEMHTYRVEWEPSDLDGEGGYIRWYADDELVYGIESDVLDFTGSMIPNEPMYILLNTAISDQWGFPLPCPSGCSCECFECGNPDCECGLPPNFCNNLPAYFEIDYVRVYQASGDSNHEIGCSTESRPTSKFIEGHKKRYTIEGNKEPLLPIQNGGGTCSTDNDCGDVTQGSCTTLFTCSCEEGFTGSTCLAHIGFDDYSYEPDSTPFSVIKIILPRNLVKGLVVLLCALTLAIFYTSRNKRKMQRYTTIRDSYKDYDMASNNGFDGSYHQSGVLPFPKQS